MSGNERQSLSFDAEPEDEAAIAQPAKEKIDPSSFAPKAQAATSTIPRDDLRDVAKEVGFESRQVSTKRRRRKRSDRTAQFNIKLRPEIVDEFWRIAEQYNDDGQETLQALISKYQD